MDDALPGGNKLSKEWEQKLRHQSYGHHPLRQEILSSEAGSWTVTQLRVNNVRVKRIYFSTDEVY